MQLECSREKLISALQNTEKISRKNLSLPILTKVLLETEGNQLQLKATNLGVGVEVALPAKISEQGRVAIDGGLLLQILQQVKRVEKISLEVTSGEMNISAEGLRAKIQIYPADDFPTLPHVEGGEKTELPVEVLVGGVKSVAYSAATNDIKPEIASVYIYKDKEDIVFVATDSFRLAEKRFPDVIHGVDFEPLLLSASSIQEVVRIFEDQDSNLQVVVGDNLVELVGDNARVTQRLVDGSFPDYRLIIPLEFQSEGVVLKQELVDQLKLVTLFSDKFQQLDVEISPEQKIFSISAANSDTGSGSVSVIAALKGEPLTARLNHRYLLDGFQSIHDDSVEVLFAGERKPVVIRGISDKTFTYLVMPMNR